MCFLQESQLYYFTVSGQEKNIQASTYHSFIFYTRKTNSRKCSQHLHVCMALYRRSLVTGRVTINSQ